MQMRGTIIRLQIQQAPLKIGPAQQRRYEPAPILSLPHVFLSDGGVCGEDGQLDVHHPHHPSRKNFGENGVSVGFIDHYTSMRSRFGTHLTDGIAGENILVQFGGMVGEPASVRSLQAEDLRNGIVILAGDGTRVRLSNLRVAEPCVEFTRYALRYPPDSRSTPAVTEALDFLRAGMRGFYSIYSGPPVRLQVGDRVLLTEAGEQA